MRTVANYLGIMLTWFCIALVGFIALIDTVTEGPTLDAVVTFVVTAVIGTLIYLVWGVEGREGST